MCSIIQKGKIKGRKVYKRWVKMFIVKLSEMNKCRTGVLLIKK